MKLDLNKPYTTEDVAELLASKDDSRHRQLRVDASGIAYLSDIVGNQQIAGLAFRMETWDAGNDYVGRKAASDAAFVDRVEKVLRSNWPNPPSTYIDVF